MSKETERNKELNDSIIALNEHNGFRYQATIYFVSRMSDGDLQFITDFCIKQERKRYKNIKFESKVDNKNE